MPGNGDIGNIKGQEEKSGGTGGKIGGFDSLIPEKSASVGPAKPPEDGKKVNYSNTPDGQKMVG